MLRFPDSLIFLLRIKYILKHTIGIPVLDVVWQRNLIEKNITIICINITIVNLKER